MRSSGSSRARSTCVSRGAARQSPHPQIAIIGINSTSHQRSNFREEDLAGSEALRLITERDYPWNRKLYALLIDKLVAAGVRAIAFDLLFVRASEGDAEFRAALERHADRVVIGSGLTEEQDVSFKKRLVFLEPNPALMPVNAPQIVGFVFHHPDTDQVIRRVDHRTSVLRENGEPDDARDMIGLAALAVAKAGGGSALDGYRIPINYQGPARTYPHLPIEELFIDSVFASDPRFAGGAALKDKIVFIGPLAEVFHDVHDTPFGTMPGVEIHAQIAADLFARSTLHDSSERANWWTALAFTIAPALLVLFMRHAALKTALLLGLAAAFVCVAQMLFVEGRVVMPMVPPLFGLVTVGGFGVALLLLVEQLERAHTFARSSIATSRKTWRASWSSGAIRSNNRSAASASRRRCSFSDVRGFTSIFETADPEELVAQLNEYFLEMVDAVLREDGTLQKFIGDAIMAVWGDTYSVGLGADAARAVRTALTMRELLAELNARWSGDPRRLQLRIGIGVNHGEVIVGNIGHPQRMEFTVLGDAINLAARLESATKQFHCDILAGAKVEELTRAEFVYRRVDLLRLKGKTRPVEVFIPLSTSVAGAPPWLAPYHRAIELYRGRQFDEAAALFCEVNAALGGDDFLCGMYLGGIL